VWGKDSKSKLLWLPYKARSVLNGKKFEAHIFGVFWRRKEVGRAGLWKMFSSTFSSRKKMNTKVTVYYAVDSCQPLLRLWGKPKLKTLGEIGGGGVATRNLNVVKHSRRVGAIGPGSQKGHVCNRPMGRCDFGFG